MRTTLESALIILLGVILSTSGDVLLKQSALVKTTPLIAGIALYALGAVPVAVAFRRVQFGTVFIVWEALTVLAALIVARALFREPLTTARLTAFVLCAGALYFSYR